MSIIKKIKLEEKIKVIKDKPRLRRGQKTISQQEEGEMVAGIKEQLKVQATAFPNYIVNTGHLTSTTSLADKVGEIQREKYPIVHEEEHLTTRSTPKDNPYRYKTPHQVYQDLSVEMQEDNLHDLDLLAASLEKKKKVEKKPVLKSPYKSKYDFVFTHHLNKISNCTDYIKFLKKLQNISLGSFPAYTGTESGDTSGIMKLICDRKKDFTLNIYNILLIYIYRFGTAVFNNREPEEGRIAKLSATIADAINMSPTQYKVLCNFIHSNLKKLFIVPLFPYNYSGQTKEEFIILMEYIERNEFTILDNTHSNKAIKQLNSISALDFVRNYHTFNICFNFLTKEVHITHKQGANLLLYKSLIHFQGMINNFEGLSKIKAHQNTKKTFQSRIAINGKTYSSELFEEMVEADITTFLSNLKFEEENYEETILKETI